MHAKFLFVTWDREMVVCSVPAGSHSLYVFAYLSKLYMFIGKGYPAVISNADEQIVHADYMCPCSISEDLSYPKMLQYELQTTPGTGLVQ